MLGVYILSALMVSPAVSAENDSILIPKVSGPWWQIAGNPDLGKYNDPRQIVLDFGIWPAKDGTWQMWACIYHAKCGGKLRLLW
ncbi:MAG: hypothetical protein JXM70_14540 [Pirellulales bacterium]|nr:hypothetical protein [Pirellulales bacterium]